MMMIRLIQLGVFCTICVLAFAQDGTLGEIAGSVSTTAPQAQSHALSGEALGMLAELR